MNPHSLETQVELLRRDLKRQKLTTIALFIGAIIAVSATRVVSQTSSRELTLRTLKIVGADGKTKILITGDPGTNKEGGAIALFDNKDNVRVGLLAESKGGTASVYGAGAEPMAILGFDGDGGSLALSANDSKTQVNVAATNDLAGLSVVGPNGKEHLMAGAEKSGGMVQ
ncbi:hypothetical protein EON80_29420, partial [bacterium]